MANVFNGPVRPSAMKAAIPAFKAKPVKKAAPRKTVR